MAGKTVTVFFTAPPTTDPLASIEFAEWIGARDFAFQIQFRHDAEDGGPRAVQKAIADADAIVADFSPTPVSGRSPHPEVLIDATLARFGPTPKPVILLHKGAEHLPFIWRQILRSGGVRGINLIEETEQAISLVGKGLAELLVQPTPPPLPARHWAGKWDVYVSQSFARGGAVPGGEGFDFANFFRAVQQVPNRFPSGMPGRMAVVQRDRDAVDVWVKIQGAISRCAATICELTPDGTAGAGPNADVITELTIAALIYQVPVIPAIQAGAKLPDAFRQLTPIEYSPDDLGSLVDLLAGRVLELMPQSYAEPIAEPIADATPIAVAESVPIDDEMSHSGHSIAPHAATALPLAIAEPIAEPIAEAEAVGSSEPFEDFKAALDAGNWADALAFYRQAVAKDPWELALCNPERFTVTEVLGAGPIGVTFRADMRSAQHPDTVPVILKALLYPERLAVGPDVVFSNLDLINRAPSAGVLPVSGWNRYPQGGQDAWWHFWSPDNSRAVPLGDYIRTHGPLAEDAVRRIGAGVVRGLISAMTYRLPHLAIRPSNVLVAQDEGKESWRVWLRDFGFQPRYDLPEFIANSTWLTDIYPYAAPEQTGEFPGTPSKSSDIFAVGHLLMAALTGSPEITPEKLEAIADERLRTAIRGCTGHDPRTRWGEHEPLLEMLRPGTLPAALVDTIRSADADDSDTDLLELNRASDIFLVPEALKFGLIEPEVPAVVSEIPHARPASARVGEPPFLTGNVGENVSAPLADAASLATFDEAPPTLFAEAPLPPNELRLPNAEPGRVRPIIAGIDLGTCTSLLAYIDEHGETQVARHSQESVVTPSVVYFPGQFVAEVGLDAKRMAVVEPEHSAQFMKLAMGDPRRARQFHGTKFNAEMLCALVLRRLVDHAVEELGGNEQVEIKDVVITVPSSWDDLRRDSTRLAARLAGLNPIGILSEPVAVSLDVALDTLRGGETVLVYDFGGGTFDVTIFRLEDNTVRLLANMGLPTLGGMHLDEKLLDHVRYLFYDEFKDKHPPDLVATPEARWQLLDQCEQVKIKLCHKKSQQKIQTGAKGFSAKYDISLEDFEFLIEAEISQTRSFVLAALLEAGLKPADIDLVLPVGGSSGIPMVRRMLNEIFGEERVAGRAVNPQEAVARGACRNAADLWCEAMRKGRVGPETVPANLVQKLGDAAVLREQTPQPLSLVTLDADGETPFAEVIVAQGSTLPAIGSLTARTAADNQATVFCRVVSGSHPDPEATEPLSSVSFDLPPGTPKGTPLKIEFWYDGSDRLFVGMWDGHSRQTQTQRAPWPGPTASEIAAWEEIVQETQIEL